MKWVNAKTNQIFIKLNAVVSGNYLWYLKMNVLESYPFQPQHNRMVKHTQAIRRQTAVKLFECF